MSSSIESRARQVFDELLDCDASERAARLDRSCAGDAPLRMRVESLLAAIRDDRFLRDPTLPAERLTGLSVVEERPGTRLGPYTLIEVIGEGGFGVVFRARQTEPVAREVAIKIVKAGMDTRQVIARFESERQALALMDHPNIARVIDGGATASGRPFFVMELVRGEPITRFCDRGMLTVEQRLELFREVCGAARHAHQKGIIHRDLKPSNILVADGDGGPRVKVIDFGVAKATGAAWSGSGVTESHQLVGTPEYMSPEQMKPGNPDVDTRSDIYSLGVVLYELLTGSTPLASEGRRSSQFDPFHIADDRAPLAPSARLREAARSSLGATLPASIEEAAGSSVLEVAGLRRTAPATLVRTLRRDLDWIVLKCLESDRARRYETVSGLADDVSRYLADEPVLATPPSVGYRLRKFIRRNRAAVAVGGAALAVGVIGTSWGVVRTLQEQQRTEEQRSAALREADGTRRINEFMHEVLTSPVPHRDGANVRLAEVLAAASAGASERFAAHPQLEAQVRDMLGAVYNNLGLWGLAVKEYQRGADLTREFAGAEDARTLRAEHRLLIGLLDVQRTGPAEALFGSTMPRVRRVFGEDDPMTLDMIRCQAVIDLQRGRLDDAEKILMGLRTHPLLANDDGSQIRWLNVMILVRKAYPTPTGDDERREHWRQIGEFGRERVERALRYHGPHSPATVQARLILASAQYNQDRFAESAEECRAILADSEERLGECHGMRADVMVELAAALARLGDREEPARLYLRAIQCSRQGFPAASIPLLSRLSDSLHYLARGRVHAEGEAFARETIAILQQYGGGHGDMLDSARIFLAHFISMAGRLDEADQLFEPMLAAEESISGSFARARLHLCFGDHLVRRGRFEDAEQHLLRAAEIRGGPTRGTWLELPDDLLVGFIDLYEAWEKPEKVSEYRLLHSGMLGLAAAESKPADDSQASSN